MFSSCYCCHIIYSDEDDGDTLDWLPMAPEIEDPEEPGWGQLEVKYNHPQTEIHYIANMR